MDEPTAIVAVLFALVSGVFLVVVGLHISFVSGCRILKGLRTGADTLFGLLATAGLIVVWFESSPWSSLTDISRWVQIASACLYLTGILIYVELRSLLDRGYSLRILVDLLGHDGSVTIEALKASYGGGRGIRGILDKRLATLARLQMVHVENSRIGPLTFWGKVMARQTSFVRRILKFETVG